MTALGEDIASAIAAFVPDYGTAISAGLSLDSLKNDFIADALDDSVSTGQMLGNAAINLGLGVVGLIPGVKIATRMGKWGKAIGKLAPQVLSGGLIAQQALSQHPQVLESWKKAAAGKDLTIDDWKNIGQSLRWISGGVKVGKATHNALKYGKTNPGKVSGKEIQTTKNGKASTAKIKNEEFETLNSKKTLKEANEYLQSTKGGKGHTISEADFKTGRFRNIPTGFGKTRRRIQGKNYTDQAELTPQQRQLQQKYTAADAAARQRVLEGRGMYRFLPQRFRPILANAPTNYQIYGSPYVKASVTKQPEIDQNPTQIQYPKPKQLPAPETREVKQLPLLSPKNPQETPGVRPSVNISKGEARRLYADFLDSYSLGRRGQARMKLGSPEYVPSRNGFNGSPSSTLPKSGEYTIKTNNGSEIKLSLSNSSLSKIISNPAKINEFRRSVASKVYTASKELKLSETAKILKELKSKGWLKSGGKINSFNLNETISEFLSKQK